MKLENHLTDMTAPGGFAWVSGLETHSDEPQ